MQINMNVSKTTAKIWFQTALVNLAFVALLGVIMCDKIAYSLPLVDQKDALNAHINFAFAGWITQALMTCMIDRLCYAGNENYFTRYRFLLWANLITAYGILISFLFGMHAYLSLAFSFLSILTFYVFAFVYWKDLNRTPTTTGSHYWFKAALVFGILSSFGPFMIAANPGKTNWYLASLYYFFTFSI